MPDVEISRFHIDRIPDNHERITRLVTDRLRATNQYTSDHPTDIQALADYSEMGFVDENEESLLAFLSTLDEDAIKTFKKAKNKLRGAFGFRKKEIYIPKQSKDIYERFPSAHEYVHGLLPWHDLSYVDTRFTLSPDFDNAREREANFGASEVLFKGPSFRDRVLGSHESIDAALVLADAFEATKSSTLWRYTEVQDRELALLTYIEKGNGYKLFRCVGSNPFMAKYPEMLVPSHIKSSHEWVSRDPLSIGAKKGDIHFSCGGERFKVRWESWTNTYQFFVLLLVPSKLHALGGLWHKLRGRPLPF